MSVRPLKRPKRRGRPLTGHVDAKRLRRLSEAEIEATSPPELANLPADFWERAVLIPPVVKQPISLRVDPDVLDWFRAQGPRYQSRMNAVLRAYMTQMRRRSRR